jgi:hypothetical protein
MTAQDIEDPGATLAGARAARADLDGVNRRQVGSLLLGAVGADQQ